MIGNGDILSEEDALKMFKETGCDGIMVGRASLGNPWIFEDIAYFLESGKKKEMPTVEEKIHVLKEHFELIIKYKGEYTATREIRKFISWYVKGMKNAKQIKENINKINSREDFYKNLNIIC